MFRKAQKKENRTINRLSVWCLSCFAILLLQPNWAEGQENYWVFFADKANTIFEPTEYFDSLAIRRRAVQGLPICDSTDFPVSEFYVSKIASVVERVRARSRWLNAVSVSATAQQLAILSKFAFVSSIEKSAGASLLASKKYDTTLSVIEYKLLKNQLNSMGASEFHQRGFTGKGVRIAVFDSGFPQVDTCFIFRHLHENNQIVATYDFVRNKPNVYAHAQHGTLVLSCISGVFNKKKMGFAPDAELLLARTDTRRQPFAEEEHWLEAAEWADKNGAHIINSSLIFTYHRYFPYDMDGKKSLVARAASIAASKGILVVNAVGNSGEDRRWRVVCTPADADSVLAVGAISPYTGFHATYSSLGPTADKRLKPNVCAYGNVVAAGRKKLVKIQGTSFACALVSGFAACAWQMFPEMKNMDIFRAIEMSGSLFPYNDYAHGYGVPQASYFVNKFQKNKANSTFTFFKDQGFLVVRVNENFVPKIGDRKVDKKNHLYYHLRDKNNFIIKYGIIEVETSEPFEIYLDEETSDCILSIYYKDYTEEYEIETIEK